MLMLRVYFQPQCFYKISNYDYNFRLKNFRIRLRIASQNKLTGIKTYDRRVQKLMCVKEEKKFFES